MTEPTADPSVVSPPASEEELRDLRLELDELDRAIVQWCEKVDRLRDDLRHAKGMRRDAVQRRRHLCFQLNEISDDVNY